MTFLEALGLVVKEMTGKDVPESDFGLIRLLADDVKVHLMSATNRSSMPVGLQYVWINQTVGRYINLKLSAKEWSAQDLRVPKTVKEGDTTVDFGDDDADAKARVGAMLDYLMKDRDIACYRRLKW